MPTFLLTDLPIGGTAQPRKYIWALKDGQWQLVPIK